MNQSPDFKKLVRSVLKIPAVLTPAVIRTIVVSALKAPLLRRRIRGDEVSRMRSHVAKGKRGRLRSGSSFVAGIEVK